MIVARSRVIVPDLARAFGPGPCYSRPRMRLVNARRINSKWNRMLFGVLFLLCSGRIVSASSRQLPTLADQSDSALSTQDDFSRAGTDESRTHRPRRSNVPHSVEIAAAPTSNHASYGPQPVHRLAAEVIDAPAPPNSTRQRADHHRAPLSFSSVILSYSSGRSPPHRA